MKTNTYKKIKKIKRIRLRKQDITNQEINDFKKNFIECDYFDCWLWNGKTNNQGYGYLIWKNQLELAHRFSYIIESLTNIFPGMLITHTCDRRTCVNPAHLFPGTHKTNSQDMMERRRHNSQKYCKHCKKEL